VPAVLRGLYQPVLEGGADAAATAKGAAEMIRDYYRERRKSAIVSAFVVFYCMVFGIILIVIALINNVITGRG